MVKDVHGKYWRLCPEDLSCTVVTENREELDALSKDQEFLRDWHMSALVDYAHERLGVLPDGRKYCLKIPGVLGGEYGGDNVATIGLEELNWSIRASRKTDQRISLTARKCRFRITD